MSYDCLSGQLVNKQQKNAFNKNEENVQQIPVIVAGEVFIHMT